MMLVCNIDLLYLEMKEARSGISRAIILVVVDDLICQLWELIIFQISSRKMERQLQFKLHSLKTHGVVFGYALKVIACHNLDEWKENFQKGSDSQKLVVIDFTASWCGPCRIISPVLTDLAKKLPNVIFLKVDVDELQPVAEEWSVEAMPTFIFLKEGKMVDKVVGAKKVELEQTVAKHIATA
ncbi:hypothetical protein HHK36_010199 [Tetracentron sinense]|uniref:Thioredoxin domain-containing protein n=1 Tax=Tetracentron sinense TaxID=13715 RepID=A0A834ZE88_TETSI|nr:hypothetical protein HHK36_010199 [Tetracentron sinense]